jgi:ribosome-associated heat shock protein Hsp15
MDTVRVDKWLWAARFFKTRSLATDACERNKVRINDAPVKPAKDVRVGDEVTVTTAGGTFVVLVRGLDYKRGSAPHAQTLYEETAESTAARQAERDKARRFADPAAQIFARPTKKDRRAIARLTAAE